MDDAHLAVVHLIGHGGAAGAEHTTVEIAVIHTQHQAAHIIVIMLALPYAGVGALLNEGLEDVVGIEN